MVYLSNSHRKFAASALTAAIVVSAVAPASAAGFTDVSDRYKEAVDALVKWKITEGLTATSYGTGKEIKRVDAAVLIAKAMGIDEEYAKDAKDSGFTDVPARAENYINALKQSGIVNGKTATTFASDQTITRGEVALMLSKAFGMEAKITSDKFTDVSGRYQSAVNALLENKVTRGKTSTTFGTDLAITRGEFAIFLYNLSVVQIPEYRMVVGSEADLKSVLTNSDVKEIVLLENITASALPVIDRNVQIDLNGKVLTGNLEYKDHSGYRAVELISSKEGGKFQGDLTVDVPNADFIVGEKVEITGKTTIINVKENTFHNKGVLNAVDIRDNDGVSFANGGTGSVLGTVALNTTGKVKLMGTLNAVEVNQAANITVDASATINKLNVKISNVVLTAPKGSIGIIEASPGVIVKDPAGTQLETQPAVQPSQPSPSPSKPPVAVNVTELIRKYEEKQKAFIESDFVNEELYEQHYYLILAQEELAKQLEGKSLTKEESEYLLHVKKTLDIYSVESFEQFIRIYANQIDLRTSDIGVTVEWTSSHPEVINPETGAVTRPAKGEEAIEVVLLAKIIGKYEAREVEYPVLVEADPNSYTTAKSLQKEEWEEYWNSNGYFTSQLAVQFDLDEIAKDYDGVQKAKITINPGLPNERVILVEDINTEANISIENPIRDSNYSLVSSASVIVELLNGDDSVANIFMNEVRVFNMKPFIIEKFEEEKKALNSESIQKYISEVESYSSEELALILTDFNKLKEDGKTLDQLHIIAQEVKLAQTVIK